MSNIKISELKTLFLFRNLSTEELEEIAKKISFSVGSFCKDELIYEPEHYRASLCFILKGACKVNKKRHDGTLVPLNTLNKGDSFGAINLFSNAEDYPTYVYASKQTEVLFIDKEEAVRLISENSKISLNFIEFLTGRILFLNNKISTFSSGSTEQKLANYLITLQKEKGATEFEFNKKLTAEALGIGRASLYRALEALESDKIIKVDNKKIYITDPPGLERITK